MGVVNLLAVLEADANFPLLDDFFAPVVRKINTLPMLRELHLFRTNDLSEPVMTFQDFVLPELTRLVI